MKRVEKVNRSVLEMFAVLDAHQAVESILAGLTPGLIYIDDTHRPQLGLAWFRHRIYLVGMPTDSRSWNNLIRLLTEDLAVQIRAEGGEAVLLHAKPAAALARVHERLGFPGVVQAVRYHYVYDHPPQAPTVELPPEYTLIPVDSGLLQDTGIQNLEWLITEMKSERPSVEDFLEKSFGICAVCQDEIVGWCLSEYNCNEHCEVGIASAEAHRRRGLGAAMTQAFLIEAYQRGMRKVGWHCWAENTASFRLAQHTGFRLEREYPVLFIPIGSE